MGQLVHVNFGQQKYPSGSIFWVEDDLCLHQR